MPHDTDYMDADEVDAPPEKRSDSDTDTNSTALLPKPFFHGKELKPGGRCTVEFVHVYDDEVEVKYVKDGSKSEPKKASEPPDEMME